MDRRGIGRFHVARHRPLEFRIYRYSDRRVQTFDPIENVVHPSGHLVHGRANFDNESNAHPWS
jgi:hypothetical protein